jgi:SLT domain-containing protein
MAQKKPKTGSMVQKLVASQVVDKYYPELASRWNAAADVARASGEPIDSTTIRFECEHEPHRVAPGVVKRWRRARRIYV